MEDLHRAIVGDVAALRAAAEVAEDGKKLTKKNTFTDFVDATDWLANSGWVDPARIAALGGSAGGLLMGRAIAAIWPSARK